MRPYTFWDKIKDFLLAPWRALEYKIAKRWLDRSFGECEYWGDKIMELFAAQRELDMQSAARKSPSEQNAALK